MATRFGKLDNRRSAVKIRGGSLAFRVPLFIRKKLNIENDEEYEFDADLLDSDNNGLLRIKIYREEKKQKK